eukprot:maker-scaffold_1-snap-gene-4.16-mRNA-1 protein AED:0.17 eAED:0.17 QI:53/1/1/1/1/1/2/270/282
MWGILDQAKKDLDEFVSTVKHDTSEVFNIGIEDTAENFGSSDSQEDKKPKVTFREFIKSDKTVFLKNELFEAPLYADFRAGIDISDRSDEISSLLSEEKLINDIFLEFVPEKLKYQEFWTRFFFLRSQHKVKAQRSSSHGFLETVTDSVTSGVSKFIQNIDDAIFNADDNEESEKVQFNGSQQQQMIHSVSKKLSQENKIFREKLEELGVNIAELLQANDIPKESPSDQKKVETKDVVVEQDGENAAPRLKGEDLIDVEFTEEVPESKGVEVEKPKSPEKQE